MADDKRKWWKKKTNWGIILFVVSKFLYVTPVTLPFAPAVETAGMALAGYGIAKRVENK